MNTVVKSSRGREENQRKKKGGGIESKRVEQYTPLISNVFINCKVKGKNFLTQKQLKVSCNSEQNRSPV